MNKSIIQNKKECYVCGTKINLHFHHILFGVRNRQKADDDGLAVYLCYQHHEGTYGVHGKKGHSLDIALKTIAEKEWISTYKATKEDFIKRYGKNYL